MTVDTRRLGYTMFREPQIQSAEYFKLRSHRHLQVFNHLCVRAKANFITADMPTGNFVILGATKGKTLRAHTAFIAREHSIEKRLERLEEQFNNLASSTWSFLFSERESEQMRELSKGMLEGSKKMRELAEQLQEVDDEG